VTLDDIGILRGTDKSALRQGYLAHYDRMFGPWRDAPLNLIEIGVYNGASLEMWRDFFSQAQIVGVDIDPRCRCHSGERIAIEIGSQADPQFLAALAERYPPFIVIDDGSHLPEHQIFTFERLFPALQAGGCYIVEDLPQWVDRSERSSAVEYFGTLAEAAMDRADERFSRVEVVQGAVALWKSCPIDYVTEVARIEPLARQAPRTESLVFWAEYLMQAGLLDRAFETVSNAIRLEPANPWFQFRLSQISDRMRDQGAALAAARRATALAPQQVIFGKWLKELEARSS